VWGVERVAGLVVGALWLLWLGYWWWSSRDTKQTVRSETLRSRMTYVAPLVVAGYLLSLRRLPFSGTSVQLFEPGAAVLLSAVAFVAAGLGFAVWARRHLGRNWSGTVTTKNDHELVRTGPYRFVRHPIYSGILLAFVGMAVGAGTWTSVCAVGLVTAAFLRKMRLEEQFMTDQFGEQYQRYRHEVPALFPGL
jgi:protein-S-isoprenylcysteine O-methyltransferase Ste14